MPLILVLPTTECRPGRGRKLRQRNRGKELRGAVLDDVARLSGLSTASVSRALNTPDKVRPQTRERVEAAVRELGYVPHGAARALASRQLRTIGALVPTLDNAIFASAINALQKRLSVSGFGLLVASSEYRKDEEFRAAQAMVAHGIDGLVMIGEVHEPALLQMLERRNIPSINIWTYSTPAGRPAIGFDNARAAGRVIDYLAGIGHRRIAMIAGAQADNDRAQARVRGVRAALQSHQIELPEAYLLERRYDIGEGRQAARVLLAHSPPPTAIVCGNDVLAVGALLEAQAQGMNVPAALSIVGFDDLPIASHLNPALTTVHVPSAEMGRLAADYLVAKVAGGSPPHATELEAQLVIRATTAPPGIAPA